jgi:hypothetical protein
MSFDKAKLLAYALGELDKKEAKAVEAFLQNNEEAARFVRENQLLAQNIQADLGKEKIPAGHGLAGLDRAAELGKIKKSPPAKYNIGWVEASAGLLIVLVVIGYWSKALVGISPRTAHQIDDTLDFPQPTYGSLSGQSGSEAGNALSAGQVKDSLAEWNNRSKAEETFGDCTFSLPDPAAALTKIAGDQKAWFYLLNGGQTQVRLTIDASVCVLSLDIQANLAADGEAEVGEVVQSLESELNSQVKDGR